jgi:type VI protein secretion system component VasK
MLDPGASPSWVSWVAAGLFAAGLAALSIWLVRTRRRPRWWQGDRTSPQDAQDDRELKIRSRHRHQYE